ncbi:hypothetical protein GCM10010317_098060 [Streptomyces mirabilis]|uniref:hypothetical protein n=1 Tax=Streptomyces mirabilis TaxID=68239 RepID=UPI00167EFCBB|nr:hypothetical protein [Streptomyces mirabilis]GHD78561.1 hypothetical protein GCM10010317_098060 [Streptomyces mirabilis]
MRIKSVSMRAGLLAATAALGVGSLLAPAATAATPPSIISKGCKSTGLWLILDDSYGIRAPRVTPLKRLNVRERDGGP